MRTKLIFGLIISAIFTYLAFRSIDYRLMIESFKGANYLLIIPGIVFMFVSLWIRAIRWGYFMEPIKRVDRRTLFSAMMIGYYANNVFPLRLGEVLRAYAIGKAAQVSRMSSFATIFVERLIDVFSLLLLLGFSILFSDYPPWIEKGALIIFAITAASTIFIVFLMLRTDQTLGFVNRIMRRFPSRMKVFVQKLLRSFLDGFGIFKKSEHFWTITWQSIVLWLFYAVIVYVTLEAFDLNTKYDLPWVASLVILVMTSIGIMIPAAPGYVGSFHWICQQALIIFGVSESESLSFAVVLHIVNFIPITLVGFYFYYKQHLSIQEAVTQSKFEEVTDNGRPTERNDKAKLAEESVKNQ